MRIVFMGTPEFAVPCLEQLFADGHEVVLVLTQADKPKGRGYALTPPPVKECALAHGVEVYQPATLKNNDETIDKLTACQADVAIVVAYGKILPPSILSIPRYGCINVHASLLPKYRGAAPIQWSVLNGEAETGVTTMWMDAGLDTGDMLLKRRVAIPEDMTAGELHDALSREGALALSDTLKQLEAGTLHPEKQDDALSCYAPMLSRSLSPIDWNRTADEIHNQIRGLNPWPSAFTSWEGKTMKIHSSQVRGDTTAEQPGTVISVHPFAVACGGGTVLLWRDVQLEGTKRMAVEDFLRGHPVKKGTVFPN